MSLWLRTTAWGLPVALSVLLSSSCTRTGIPVPAAPPAGIIVVVIDTLRADHLGCHGYARPTSPFIDTLAREGAQFVHAHAPAPWTVPSTASIMTGLYPSEHGAELPGPVRHLGETPPLQMADQVRTLSQILQERGFATALFSANPYLFGRFKRGFDVAEVGRRTATEITDAALRFLTGHSDRPFFIHIQYMDLHQPLEPPSEFAALFPVASPQPAEDRHKEWAYADGKQLDTPGFAAFRDHKLALYDGALRYVDSEIARLWAGVEALALAESTLVVVTSDHGEEFWDHALVGADMGGDPRGFYGIGHGHSMFQEQLRAPLIFRGPRVAAGWRIESPVSLVDITPTLLEMVDLGAPPAMSGTSLVPHFQASETEDRRRSRPLFAESPAYGPDAWSLIDWPYKLIARSDQRSLMFDLENDPSEKVDLSQTMPELHAELLARLESYRRSLSAIGQTEPMTLEDETRDQLRSLGYLE